MSKLFATKFDYASNSCVIPVDDPYEELCQAGQVCSTSLMRYSNMYEFLMVMHLISQAARCWQGSRPNKHVVLASDLCVYPMEACVKRDKIVLSS